jgi:hypothetical protein
VITWLGKSPAAGRQRPANPRLLLHLRCSYILVEVWRMILSKGGNWSVAGTMDEPIYDLYVTAARGVVPQVRVTVRGPGG